MWKIATYILKGGLREQVAGLETQLQRAVEDFREMQGRRVPRAGLRVPRGPGGRPLAGAGRGGGGAARLRGRGVTRHGPVRYSEILNLFKISDKLIKRSSCSSPSFSFPVSVIKFSGHIPTSIE